MHIESIKCDIDLKGYVLNNIVKSFSRIEGTMLAPQQSLVGTLDNKAFINNSTDSYNVRIKYNADRINMMNPFR